MGIRHQNHPVDIEVGATNRSPRQRQRTNQPKKERKIRIFAPILTCIGILIFVKIIGFIVMYPELIVWILFFSAIIGLPIIIGDNWKD